MGMVFVPMIGDFTAENGPFEKPWYVQTYVDMVFFHSKLLLSYWDGLTLTNLMEGVVKKPVEKPRQRVCSV